MQKVDIIIKTMRAEKYFSICMLFFRANLTKQIYFLNVVVTFLLEISLMC